MVKKPLKVIVAIIIMGTLMLSLVSCSSSPSQESQSGGGKQATINVFHAGSLSLPFKDMKEEFEKTHPNITVKLSSAGSKALAQKILTLHDQGQPLPEIYASADYSLISDLIMQKGLADFNILFARNSIVIAYTDDSKYADEITENNWYEILSRKDVRMGRSDPEQDPCGYRSVLVMQLAEKYYNKPGLYRALKDHPGTVIKPKEVDLIADLETGNIDYFWIYESVARQHHFKYITLPKQINLSSLEYANFYKTASLTLKKPDGSEYTVFGKPIVYGITLIKEAPELDAAKEFLKFVLTDGLSILEKNGQPAVNPPQYIGSVPDFLKGLVQPANP